MKPCRANNKASGDWESFASICAVPSGTSWEILKLPLCSTASLQKKLLIFTTRLRRRDGRPIQSGDLNRYFLKSLTRKLPRALKYSPQVYQEDPVVFATPLPAHMHTEFVRPLTRWNYHSVIEASCLVPLAMGWPLLPEHVNNGDPQRFAGDPTQYF